MLALPGHLCGTRIQPLPTPRVPPPNGMAMLPPLGPGRELHRGRGELEQWQLARIPARRARDGQLGAICVSKRHARGVLSGYERERDVWAGQGVRHWHRRAHGRGRAGRDRVRGTAQPPVRRQEHGVRPTQIGDVVRLTG